MNITNKIKQLLSLLTCVLLLVSLAVLVHGRLMGHDLRDAAADSSASAPVSSYAAADTAAAITTLADGTIVVNTTSIAKDITGYAGRVPLEISIKDNVVTGIKALGNSESATFFDRASTLFAQWTGKSVSQAAAMKVDAVSGATFSSRAIIGNVRRGLQYAEQVESGQAQPSAAVDTTPALALKDILGLVVVVLAATVPLLTRSRKWHIVQMLLNVVVLGFWCGTFLSYTSVMGLLANGWTGWTSAAFVIILIVAFVYPLLGKPSYYCSNVCPFGSMQQLAGSSVRYKLRLAPATVRRLDVARQVLWALLMLFIWSGVWSAWTDYEPFTAFLFGTASWVAIVIAVVFVLLSFVVTRPYCRFVCPVGTLLRYSQM